jgi:hypothetical protein
LSTLMSCQALAHSYWDDKEIYRTWTHRLFSSYAIWLFFLFIGPQQKTRLLRHSACVCVCVCVYTYLLTCRLEKMQSRYGRGKHGNNILLYMRKIKSQWFPKVHMGSSQLELSASFYSVGTSLLC